jgi:hypothetical protein
VHVAVRTDAQVQVLAQPGRAQLQRRERPDVAGEDGLPEAGSGQGGDGVRRAGHGANVRGLGSVHRGDPAGQRREEVIYPALRLGHPGELQRVQGDRPVGPPGLRRYCGQLAAE